MVNWVKDDEVELTIERKAVAFTLTIKSEPPGVKVTLDGIERVTPWKVGLTYPTTVTVQVQEEGFIEWEDGSTDPVRTIEVSEDMTLIAYYEAVVVPWKTIAVVTGFVAVLGSIIYAARRKEK